MFDEKDLMLVDYFNIIYLKNQLLTLSASSLLEKYQTEDMYEVFLDTIHIIKEIDSAFLLFDNRFYQKIETVIDTYRFLYQSPQYNTVCNDIIRHLNTISYYSRELKNIMKDNYLDYHQDMRKMSFTSEDDFLYAIGYDAVSLYQLQRGDLHAVDDTYFLGSINYFVELVPELFEETSIHNQAVTKIAEISRQRGYRNRENRQFAQVTMNHLQKIKNKDKGSRA